MAGKNDSSNVGPRDDRDQDRVASMADEGGAAGAKMDTREQLEAAPRSRLKKRRRIPWMWGAAAASAAVGGVALARTIAGSQPRRAGVTEIESGPTTERGSERVRRKAKRSAQRTGSARTRARVQSGARAQSVRKGSKSARSKAAVIEPRAQSGRGAPKRRRGGNNANVRKAARTRQTAANR